MIECQFIELSRIAPKYLGILKIYIFILKK
jgi:hypothetical protein